MEKFLVELLNLIAIGAILCFPLFKTKGKGILAVSVITIQVIIASVVAISVFNNGLIEFYYRGSWVTGEIPVRIDYLSAWFVLIISFTFATGAWYGIRYMMAYKSQSGNLASHAAAYLLAYTALVDICLVQNGLVFLILWEVMALSSFVLVIFEHYKIRTLKAGINFLIQSHVSILFLTIAIMMVKVNTGTFDFAAISSSTYTQPAAIAVGLFIFFFCGFAIKAGFVPFHTWLPLAHPAAPAHVSGVMSGVIIKIGIYGILRMVLLIKCDMVFIGYFILFISVITGVYGVMLAIVQHNLKRLLAYHSIENIGIIGIGIGLGCLGIGYNNPLLVASGFGGGLLHVLNHSLFKSLLFYVSGNVYQATHNLEIDTLGGLIRKMPHSGYLFLIASLAICGLPPFNGFVSEFFIYNGLFNGLISNNFLFILFILFAILGLVLIGGLALICFTKAFGVVFLGNPRSSKPLAPVNESFIKAAPLYLIALFILIIGVFPVLFGPMLIKTVYLFLPESGTQATLELNNTLQSLTAIGWYSLGFIGLTALLYFIRKLVTAKRSQASDVTWGCGYTGSAEKTQYTASSFVRTYRKLAEPVLMIKRKKNEAAGLYPDRISQATHPYDKIEYWLIDKPLLFIRSFLKHFTFLQNGHIQAYILYGFVFVGLTILLPVIVEKIIELVNFLNQL